MAGGRSFARGEEYFQDGRVRGMVENSGTIAATVEGTDEYRVKLWVDDDELGFSCDCPVGTEDEFCKHAVAVGLAWLEQDNVRCPSGKDSVRPAEIMDNVRAYLARQEKDVLVELLMKQVVEDNRLRRKLGMKAARNTSSGIDLMPYRAAINQAISAERFVDYGSAWGYARGIGEVVDSIEELVNEGHATEGVEMAEYALEAVEEAMGYVDDSSGNMGELLERLQEIHHAACQKAKSEPEALAKRLFEWELRTEYDVFYGASRTYADVLGEKGLALYRRLAEEQWAHVPGLKAGQDDPAKYGKRFRLTHVMETLAQQSNDVEALVAVKSRDLSSASQYLEIAQVYKQAGKLDVALEWAERGLKDFPEKTDSRLREFLAEEYHGRNRQPEALALIWAEFVDSTHLDQYKKLKIHADRAGEWLTWRVKALAFLKEQADKAKREEKRNRWDWGPRADYSELVRIFLWEKDVEAAWRHAQEGGCSEGLWLELADLRGKYHPEEALPIYQRQIEPALGHKNNVAYEEAVRFLRKIRMVMGLLGQNKEFDQYLESLRAAHKPKRNFIKLLDQEKWS
jgi:uncharacterized Zn finger protein